MWSQTPLLHHLALWNRPTSQTTPAHSPELSTWCILDIARPACSVPTQLSQGIYERIVYRAFLPAFWWVLRSVGSSVCWVHRDGQEGRCLRSVGRHRPNRGLYASLYRGNRVLVRSSLLLAQTVGPRCGILSCWRVLVSLWTTRMLGDVKAGPAKTQGCCREKQNHNRKRNTTGSVYSTYMVELMSTLSSTTFCGLIFGRYCYRRPGIVIRVIFHDWNLLKTHDVVTDRIDHLS